MITAVPTEQMSAIVQVVVISPADAVALNSSCDVRGQLFQLVERARPVLTAYADAMRRTIAELLNRV
jgi:hypothetical protein